MNRSEGAKKVGPPQKNRLVQILIAPMLLIWIFYQKSSHNINPYNRSLIWWTFLFLTFQKVPWSNLTATEVSPSIALFLASCNLPWYLIAWWLCFYSFDFSQKIIICKPETNNKNTGFSLFQFCPLVTLLKLFSLWLTLMQKAIPCQYPN